MAKEKTELREGVLPSIRLVSPEEEGIGPKSIRDFFGFKEEWDEDVQDGFLKNLVYTFRIGLAIYFVFEMFKIAIALIK